jgi:crotonobetainyl-CoA:carnitine CoA-transferase CaiB-like acyl-CoA transferase
MSASGRLTGPLAGLRVLDLATLFAAPALSTHLGDLGADVVKVEPPSGDPQRLIGPMRLDRSLVWTLVSRNKRSLALDYESADGRALLHELTTVADVVVVNQPTPVLARWGCTYAEISVRNPRAVVVSMSAFGATGPYAGRPGNGSLAEAFSGLTNLVGEADGPPTLPSVPLGDCLSALSGAMAVISACYWRDANGGTGQFIDLAMYEPVLALLGTAMVNWTPGQPLPSRTGSRYPGGVAIRNVYRTVNGEWVVLAGMTDPQVARILAVIGADTPADHARYGWSADRQSAADALDALVAAWIREHDVDTVVDEFDQARIPVMRVNDLATVIDDPHIVHRQNISAVTDPELGTVLMPTPTPTFEKTPAAIRWPGPALGAHTDEVRAAWLGS